MIDMPAAAHELLAIDYWEQIRQAVVKDYGPVIDIVRKTWDKESLLDIMRGRIAVPDEVINEALAKRLDDDGNIQALSITSKENGRMEIHAQTKSIGRIELSGTVDAFVHNGQESYVAYTVKERALKDHGLMSWFVSRISLSMAERLFGHVELPETLPTKIRHNTITVDFHERLRQSDLGRAEVEGHALLDMLHIKQAVPHDGYVEFTTSLEVPDEVKMMLINMVTG